MKQKAYCKYCNRPVYAVDNFIVEHKEPESSAVCYGSGTYVDIVIEDTK